MRHVFRITASEQGFTDMIARGELTRAFMDAAQARPSYDTAHDRGLKTMSIGHADLRDIADLAGEETAATMREMMRVTEATAKQRGWPDKILDHTLGRLMKLRGTPYGPVVRFNCTPTKDPGVTFQSDIYSP